MKNRLSVFFWLWMPIVYCLLLSLGYLVVNVLLSPYKYDWGSITYALLFLLIYALVLTPVMSILYCKRIHTMSWKKYLCCVYNAITMSLYFTICIRPTSFIGVFHSVLSIPWLAVFFPSLICGVITLVVSDVKKASDVRNSSVS